MNVAHASKLVAVWLALLALLGATVAAAHLPLGAFGAAVGLAIAAVKASLIALAFMHLRESAPVVRLAAALGLLWLGIFFAFALSDYLTRSSF